MKLELYESRGNLDKINSSITSASELHISNAVSPNSEVYIDKLRGEPGTHTWANVIDNIVMQEDVAFVVVRSNKRQLLAISHNPKITSSDNYRLVWTDIALNIPAISDLTDGRKTIYTQSNFNAQTKMWKTVQGFIEATNGRKNWDIIIVKVDKTLEKTRADRAESKRDREYKPNEFGYDSYIKTLKEKLKFRLIQYSESKLANIKSEEEFKTMLLNNNALTPAKIKIEDIIYIRDDTSGRITDNNRGYYLNAYYRYDGSKTGIPVILRYNIEIKNMKEIVISKIMFSKDRYGDRDIISFEDGLERIKSYR